MSAASLMRAKLRTAWPKLWSQQRSTIPFSAVRVGLLIQVCCSRHPPARRPGYRW